MFIMIQKDNVDVSICHHTLYLLEQIDNITTAENDLFRADTLQECLDFTKTEQYKELVNSDSEILIVEVNVKVVKEITHSLKVNL